MSFIVEKIEEISTDYRGDIDGMRAMAVLAVVFYHLGFEQFSGGYVGVDVFFVISGFLITKLIYSGVQKETFSYSTFYARRVRRLFPALFFTLFITFVFGFFLLSPEHLENLSQSLFYAILSTSNFFFWVESGYFDASADLKPLLHTWSLSVEEQFYLVWPILLVSFLCFKRDWVPIIFLLCVGTISLFCSQIWLSQDASAVFFLAPFRVCEFAIGAILVWVHNYRIKLQLFDDALVAVGLGLIAYSVTSYSEKTLFPGLSSMLPCLGTALLIYGGQAKYLGKFLSNKVTASIGLISYSLYLVHWPIIVFYKYWSAESLKFLEQLALFIVSIFVASAMYVFIETPFRGAINKEKSFSPPAFCLIAALLSIALIFPVVHAWANNGWGWRFSSDIASPLQEVSFQKDQVIKAAKKLDKNKPFSAVSNKKIVFIGDSFTRDIILSLQLNDKLSPSDYTWLGVGHRCQPILEPVNLIVNYPFDKTDQYCADMIMDTLNNPVLHDAKYIVIASRFYMWSAKHFGDFLDVLKEKNKNIFVVGRKPEFKYEVSKLLKNHGKVEGFQDVLASSRKTEVDEINTLIKEATLSRSLAYYSLDEITCPEGICSGLDQDNALLYYDWGHFTLEGHKFFGHRMSTDGFLSEIYSDTALGH